MAEYNIFNSQWTAQQIEASIGKNPRIGESGNWEVWNMSTMQYVDTGVLAEGKSISHVDRTSGTGLPGTTDTYTIYDNSETVIGTFDVHNGSDGQGSPGSQTPKMDGTAAVGTANAYSREDHVHPHDDSKADLVDGKVPSDQLPPMDYQPTINVSGILKGNGAGGISAAVAGTDFAPAGYGLGGNSRLIASTDDLNNITANGWYYFSSSPIHAPTQATDGWNGAYSYMRVDKSVNAVTQTVYCSNASSVYGCVIKRFSVSGTWYPWEWVNPPMNNGVEYRTTERYNGKPVYVKLVNFGSLPNATSKSVAYSTDSCSPITVNAVVSGQTAPTLTIGGGGLPTSFASDKIVDIRANGSNVMIACGGDRSALTATVFVKYYKTTD